MRSTRRARSAMKDSDDDLHSNEDVDVGRRQANNTRERYGCKAENGIICFYLQDPSAGHQLGLQGAREDVHTTPAGKHLQVPLPSRYISLPPLNF